MAKKKKRTAPPSQPRASAAHSRGDAELVGIVAIALAALSPFAFVSQSAYFVDTTRWVAMLLAGAACLWAWARPGALSGSSNTTLWLDRAIGAFAVVVIASAALSAHPAQAFTYGAERNYLGAPSWLAMLLVFFTASRVRLTRRVHIALRFALIASLPFAVWGLTQGLQHQMITGGFMNTDQFGPVMLMCVPLAVVEFRAARGKPIESALWAASALLLLVSAVVGDSSSAVVAGAAVLVCVTFLLTPDLLHIDGARNRRVAVIAGGSALTLGALLVSVGLFAPSALPGQVGAWFEQALHSRSVFARVEFWRTSWAIFKDHPILGVGPDGFHVASQGYLTRTLMEFAADRTAGGFGILIREPHSIPALVLAQFGILGAIASSALAATWGLAFTRRKAEEPRAASVRTAYALSFGIWLLMQLFVPFSTTFGILPAAVLGLAVAPAPSSRGSEAPRRSQFAEAFSRLWNLRSVAVSTAVLGTLAASWLGVSSLAGESNLKKLDAGLSPSQSVAVLETAIGWQPTRPYLRYQLLRQQGFDAMYAGKQAMQQYENDVDAAGDGVLGVGVYTAKLSQIALDYSQLSGDTQAASWADAHMKRALQLSPNHVDVVLEAIHTSVLQGDAGAARKYLALATELRIRTDRSRLYQQQTERLLGNTATADSLADIVKLHTPELADLLR
ncbi:MAG: hypothetical protein CVT67_01810 [Actinobacteria bacterium HGW-Actinobacteria-7]|nr:MAG: hypothetical protein CVT67_01810 [Actinobacteria bacterium HGW-Actinobacteria-7]